MPKLVDICSNALIPKAQRFYIKSEVENRLQEIDKNVVLNKSLRELGQRYEKAEIPSGRSLRSDLLDESLALIFEDHTEKAALLISILLAMYFDPDYINSHAWFEYEIFIKSLPLHDIVLLLTAATILGVVDLPDISQ